jgi:gliding motility-associated protein GldM
MAIPKEPRALMINLMYLVLTAMLALNVSAEIINAFFMLDKGIKHTNEIVDLSLKNTIEIMKKTVDEGKPDLKPIAEAAAQVPDKIKKLLDKINQLRVKMTDESGGLSSTKEHESKWKGYGFNKIVISPDTKMDGKPMGKKDKDVPTRIFVNENEGEKLKTLIHDTRKELFSVVDELAAALKAKPIKGVKLNDSDIEELKKELVLEEVDDKLWKEAGKKNWSDFVFNQMPVASIYPLLRKFENDAKNAASQVVNYLSSNMGNKVLVYDKFDVFSQSPKPYILLGETYEAEIALGAFSSQAKFSVNVGGSNLPVDGAKAKYSAKPSTVGTQKYNATITVVNPLTGDTETVKKEFSYEVGVPSCTVSADAMNVFYIGVVNPISVSAAGVSSNDIAVSLSGAGGGTLTKVSNSKYNVNVTTQTKKGEFCNVVVTNTKTGKKLCEFPYRVKKIPNPSALNTSGKNSGTVGNGEMKIQTAIVAVLDNFDFDAKCEITGFELWYTAPRQDPVKATNQGGKFGADVMKYVSQAKPGATYQFTDVKGRCPGDTVSRNLNGLSFIVK